MFYVNQFFRYNVYHKQPSSYTDVTINTSMEDSTGRFHYTWENVDCYIPLLSVSSGRGRMSRISFWRNPSRLFPSDDVYRQLSPLLSHKLLLFKR